MKFIEFDFDIKIKGVFKPSKFSERIKYSFKEQRVLYVVTKSFDVELSTGEIITIQKGFETDLCSVPPFLHSTISNCPTNLKAYILHDWIYKEDLYRDELGDEKAKEKADKEMLFLANKLDQLHGVKNRNKIRYLAVKWFGKGVFERRKGDY